MNKKIIYLILISTILLAGCENQVDTLITEQMSTTTSPTKEITTTTTTSEPVEDNLDDYWLAEMGVTWSDEKYVTSTLTVNEAKFDPETFEKYFFGYWVGVENNSRIINENGNTLMSSGELIWVTDDIILTFHIEGGVYKVYWLNINEPNNLYQLDEMAIDDNDDGTITIFCQGLKRHHWISVFYKERDCDPINDETLVTRFRSAALCNEYGIRQEYLDLDVLNTRVFTDVWWTDENGEEHFKGDPYFLSDNFLESKNENEIILRTKLYSHETYEPSVSVRFRVFYNGEKWTNEVIEVI